MNNKTAKIIRLVYGSLVGLSAIAAGICLIAGCLSIYHSGGDQIYTAQKVAEAFAPIAPVVYLALALAIGSFILDFVLPLEKRKAKPEKDHQAQLNRLLEKRDITQGDPAVLQGILKAENTRRLHWLISILLLAAGSVLFLIIGVIGQTWETGDSTTPMTQAVYILLPCLAVPFGYAVFSAYYNKVSLQRQIDLVKQLPVVEKSSAAAAGNGGRAVQIARVVICFAALTLLIYGFLSGGTADVITKAVNICTECVGLG